MSGTRTAIVDAVAAAAPVAIVYFSGWAYLSAYLGKFDIDATQVDFSLATVLVYAFVPLNTWAVICTVAFFALLYCVCVLYRPLVRHASRVSLVLVAVSAIVLLFIVKGTATAEADRMATLVWLGKKSISNAVVKAPDKPDASYSDFKTCSSERRLRQILGTTDTLYLLCRNADSPCWYGKLFAVRNDGTIVYWAERRRRSDANMSSCKS